MSTERISIEEMCRQLLQKAEDDGLITHTEYDVTPEDLSAGDLVGMANLLAEFMRHNSPQNNG